ncbi:MAG: DUF5060 domain-containing protein [Deltaproteobacteria bacterium]|nr:DUF5060 domain-containing protein [Deltaproteobacteria bacterium]
MLQVALYGLLQVPLAVDRVVDNPYDPAQISVEAHITDPDGGTREWPAFYDGEGWLLRYQPQELGLHDVEVQVDGVPVQSFAFRAHPGRTHGPLHPDGYAFRHADGTPFVAVGLNLGWSAGGGSEDYDRWFSEMEAAGGTFARVWFTHFTGQDPEWPHLGRMDPDAGEEVDRLLDLAAEHGVMVMLVLWQHSELESARWSSWDSNPYNADNGGPCPDSLCFFQDPTARAFQDRLVRYAVARWGAHPALAAWEVINEADGVQTVMGSTVASWAASHADTLRSLEDGLHPVSWSYTLPPQVDPGQVWEGADFTQVHSYLLTDVGPVAGGVSTALERWPGPVLVGEWGLDWSGDLDLADTEGLTWHNANWTALASGSAGTALTWWWDNHVEPEDLWYRMTGPATVASGLDLPSMAPVEIDVDHPELEVYGRSDGKTALVWVHDIDWTVGRSEPVPRRGARLSLDGLPEGCATLHDTVTGQALDVMDAVDGVLDLPTIRGDVAVIVGAEPCAEPTGCGCWTANPGARAPAGALLLLAVLPIRRRSRPR